MRTGHSTLTRVGLSKSLFYGHFILISSLLLTRWQQVNCNLDICSRHLNNILLQSFEPQTNIKCSSSLNINVAQSKPYYALFYVIHSYLTDTFLQLDNQSKYTCLPRKNSRCLSTAASNGSTSFFLRSSIFVNFERPSTRMAFLPSMLRT